MKTQKRHLHDGPCYVGMDREPILACHPVLVGDSIYDEDASSLAYRRKP